MSTATTPAEQADDAEAGDCTAVLVIGCGCHPDCRHGAALSCVRRRHRAADGHRTRDGIQWKATAGG